MAHHQRNQASKVFLRGIASVLGSATSQYNERIMRGKASERGYRWRWVCSSGRVRRPSGTDRPGAAGGLDRSFGSRGRAGRVRPEEDAVRDGCRSAAGRVPTGGEPRIARTARTNGNRGYPYPRGPWSKVRPCSRFPDRREGWSGHRTDAGRPEWAGMRNGRRIRDDRPSGRGRSGRTGPL
jgi:hypothetical protein